VSCTAVLAAISAAAAPACAQLLSHDRPHAPAVVCFAEATAPRYMDRINSLVALWNHVLGGGADYAPTIKYAAGCT
jgi:hypothetical protein